MTSVKSFHLCLDLGRGGFVIFIRRLHRMTGFRFQLGVRVAIRGIVGAFEIPEPFILKTGYDSVGKFAANLIPRDSQPSESQQALEIFLTPS